MRTPIAALLLSTLAGPAHAQVVMSPLSPATVKYRDAGAKPATGRDGAAAIESRALRDRAGTVDVEVTTAAFEANTPATGALSKVQVKLLADDGSVMQTDNYRKSLLGDGHANLVYDGLPRGQAVQVTASVTADNRTALVTAATQVRLRPDLEVTGIGAPARASAGLPVPVVVAVHEANGDLGARATCELLADGVVVDSMPGVWVDAGSSVGCAFQVAFATPGRKALLGRVRGVAPADFDDGNNDFAATLDIVDATQPFERMQVVAVDGLIDYHNRWTRRFERFGGGHAYQVEEEGRKSRDQYLSIYAEFAADTWDEGASLSFTQHLDDAAVGDIDVAVADLPQRFAGEGYRCANAQLDGQMMGICNSAGRSTLFFMRNAYDTVYVNRATVSGDVEWFAPAWDFSGSGAGGTFRTLGTTYRGSARYTSAAGSRYGELTATFGAPVESSWNVDSTWSVVMPEGVLYNTYLARSYSWNRSAVSMTGF